MTQSELKKLRIHFMNEVITALDIKPSILRNVAYFLGIKKTASGDEFTQEQLNYLIKNKNKFNRR